eukprot:SAG11_NODE_23529_length_387_cov_0.694444_1_plen_92_part_10
MCVSVCTAWPGIAFASVLSSLLVLADETENEKTNKKRQTDQTTAGKSVTAHPGQRGDPDIFQHADCAAVRRPHRELVRRDADRALGRLLPRR